MTPALIIFDLAGTTVRDNRDVHKALQRALLDEGVSISLEEANVVMGIPKPVAIEQLLRDKKLDNRINERWIQTIHQRFQNYMIQFYQNDETVEEKEGVSALFAALRNRGIIVGVDTGFDRSITQPLLDRLGWIKNDLVSLSVTSDEVPRGRPFPDMIYKAMNLAGVQDSSLVAKVGDTLSDLEEGRSAGCKWVVGVTDGAFSREALSKGYSTHLIDTIQELRSIFNIE